MKHPNGKIVQLNKKNHRYYVKGEKHNFISVTQMLGKFFPKFKTKEVAKKCAESRGVHWEDLVKEWKQMGVDAANRGKKYHKFSEEVYKNYMKGKYKNRDMGFGKDVIEKRMEKILLNLYTNYVPIHPEAVVASFQFGVAGSLDLLLVDPINYRLLIADWKFVKEIKCSNDWEKANFPIQHLDNCNYYKYCTQLNTYSFIIKKEKYFPNYPDHDMMIFHVKEDLIDSIVVPDMQQNIRNMFIELERKKNGWKT